MLHILFKGGYLSQELHLSKDLNPINPINQMLIDFSNIFILFYLK